jgi:hypothetical protein
VAVKESIDAIDDIDASIGVDKGMEDVDACMEDECMEDVDACMEDECMEDLNACMDSDEASIGFAVCKEDVDACIEVTACAFIGATACAFAERVEALIVEASIGVASEPTPESTLASEMSTVFLASDLSMNFLMKFT